MLKIEADDLQELFDALTTHGYQVLGPTVRDGAIVYDEIRTAAELPMGYGDTQEKGTYRIFQRGDSAFFGFNMGPQSWKKFLFRSRERLFRAARSNGEMEIAPETAIGNDAAKMAFVGVRACEIQALEVQDRVFVKGPYRDEPYSRRREGVLIIAVQCTRSASTCFCASMRAGPEVTSGYDVVMTEVLTGEEHYFVCHAATASGRKVLASVSQVAAKADEVLLAEEQVRGAAETQVRSIPFEAFPGLLMRNFEHARWEEVAERCLSCTNCTIVCPTCFCSTIENVTDLQGQNSEQWRRWDSCFNLDHSQLHGGSVRSSVRSRYRQWLTHKLDTWIDQYGISGCVGCGRCIAWCPVGIDITEETQAIYSRPQAAQGRES
jgi:ferredoxin